MITLQRNSFMHKALGLINQPRFNLFEKIIRKPYHSHLSPLYSLGIDTEAQVKLMHKVS